MMRIFAVAMVVTIGAAQAAECPPDRPIKKTVQQFGGVVICTLMVCIGKLICPDGGNKLNGTDCYYGPASDCNKCSGPAPEERCFTQAEIDAAAPPKCENPALCIDSTARTQTPLTWDHSR